MSGDPAQQPSGSAPGSATGEPSEDELRAAYEAELSRMTPADMMLQAAVSLLHLGARRLGLSGAAERSQGNDTASGTREHKVGGTGSQSAEPGAGGAPGEGRDLEQVRDAIDGVRALLGILERSMPRELRPLRDALSQLQLAYARETQAGAAAPPSSEKAQPAGGEDTPTAEERPGAPGPAQASGRLWVPGS